MKYVGEIVLEAVTTGTEDEDEEELGLSSGNSSMVTRVTVCVEGVTKVEGPGKILGAELRRRESNISAKSLSGAGGRGSDCWGAEALLAKLTMGAVLTLGVAVVVGRGAEEVKEGTILGLLNHGCCSSFIAAISARLSPCSTRFASTATIVCEFRVLWWEIYFNRLDEEEEVVASWRSGS